MSSRRPPASPFQHVWDDAARMADDGAELTSIVSTALSNANAQIEVDSLAAVPAHGRAFFSTLGKALAWAVLLDVCVLGIGSFGAGPLSVVRLIICVVALVWAVAFGTLAANQRVQRGRIRVAAAARTVVSRIAEEAAGLVWSSQIPGSWRPLGPPVVGTSDSGRSAADETTATRWLRRFGGAGDAAGAQLTDGTPTDLLRIVKRARGVPVVLFALPDAPYSDSTRTLADEYGVALFRLGSPDLLPGNTVSSQVWAAYRDPAATEPPIEIVRRRWLAAEPARRSPTSASR